VDDFAMEGCFYLGLPDPGLQTTKPFFWLKIFWNLEHHPSV